MKATQKELELVVREFAGEEVVRLVRYMKRRKEFSEFELAEQLGEEINKTRSMLYRLHKVNLATSVRKRDDDRGLYVYYWSFQKYRVPELVRRLKEEKLERLKQALESQEGKVYFNCADACVTTDFDTAVNFNFKCPECGQIMNQKKVCKESLATLKTKIVELEKDIK